MVRRVPRETRMTPRLLLSMYSCIINSHAARQNAPRGDQNDGVPASAHPLQLQNPMSTSHSPTQK
jgi:hypothetical protein